MLVMSRLVSEKIYIGGPDISLTVVSIDSREKVRIGVEAPRAIPVYRGELTLRPDFNWGTAVKRHTDKLAAAVDALHRVSAADGGKAGDIARAALAELE